ncbi:hypothetical protein V6N12_030328 [Hibiscus sabdariffa]|uniref:OTU domain-containing protein n=1 Tax=Hibiscus sabdariffa TaxID=183260 RepID=A0ABR2C243_9ROSI
MFRVRGTLGYGAGRSSHPKQIVHQFEAEKQIVQSKGDLQINSPYLIKKNRETFEPFIEDDVPFDEYCQSMEKDGTWAGHMELQAASLVTHRNICIHRVRSYLLLSSMVSFRHHAKQLAWSIFCRKADADISASSNQAKAAVSKPKGAAGKDSINTGSIKLVMAGSGCESAEKVEQICVGKHQFLVL